MPINPEPIRLVWTWDAEAPIACYRPAPPEITLSATQWLRLSRFEKQRALYHELGHHDTQALWFWTDDPADRVNILIAEAKASRAGLERRIPDAQVDVAVAEGWELWRMAEEWRVDEVTARRRLAVYSRRAW
jgi:hypothetical protein